MPRGQKSKLRAREKRQRTRAQTQDLKVGQATAAEKEESPSSSSSVLGDTPSSSLALGIPQKPQREPPTTPAAAAMSGTGPDEGEESQDEENASSSQASASTERSLKDPLTRKTKMLVQFLLYKYKMKEPTTKAEMLKIISKKYKEHFPEIFRKVSQRTELVFGLALKEVNPTTHSYILVSMLGPSNDENESSAWSLPRNGLLMPLLSVIFLNGNCAGEEEIWEFLNMLGIYDGKRHLIFGEPRKLITQDLVQEKYLEYQQVPNSDPPRYQFLWGPRAYAETSKMKVLEFLAKVNDTTPNNFPLLYEDALRDEEERTGARPRVAARRGTTAVTSAYSRATSSSSSHPM
ncbi:PREDICTED: melanoma-associated antigen B4 [Colobus angolensis palliatus]|uniref:melanoma-associated antigen B4 n=1 Tax=Colobus angolensis palliatus TaxID=336983 RepID=UPI0005F3AD44|nr:PREDICTED: melanoma-associated antigen B4 [Colobus angolensis palliatus]